MKRRIILITSFLMLCVFISGQSVNNNSKQFLTSYFQNLSAYNNLYINDKVFIHTDKDIYYPGEKVWFESYVLNGINHNLANNSQTLFLYLMNKKGNTLFKQSFAMDNGISNGFFKIPLDVKNQNLILVAFPNRIKNFDYHPWFTKKIAVQQPLVPELLIDLDFNKALMIREDLMGARAKVTKLNSQPVQNATVRYKLKVGNNTVERGRVKTDRSGVGRIQFDIPDDADKEKMKLFVKARHRIFNTSHMTVPLPRPVLPVDIKIVPEGGTLLSGIPNKIGIRALDSLNRAFNFQAKLLDENNVLIKNISAKHEGRGIFSFTPKAGKKYKIRIVNPANIEQEFFLSEPHSQGVQLIKDKVSEDTLFMKFQTKNNFDSQKVTIIGQVRGELYYGKEKIINTDHSSLKIPTHHFPNGVINFYVYNNGRLISGRSVYINPNKRLYIDIETDKNFYEPREKTKITISATDEEGNPVSAKISLAAVNQTGIKQQAERQNILQEMFLNYNLEYGTAFPFIDYQHFDKYEDAMEAGLLTNDWKGYNLKVLNKLNDRMIKFSDQSDTLLSYIEKSFQKEISQNENFLKLSYRNYSALPGSNPQLYEKIQLEQKKKATADNGNKRIITSSNKTSIYDIINEIKPYQMEGNKIIFYGSRNSLESQQGALIVIDGIKMGDNASVLNSLSLNDVYSVNVITDPAEVHKYSGIYSAGVIEITTKGATYVSEDSDEQGTSTSKFEGPEYGDNDAATGGHDLRTTLHWESQINTGKDGKAQVSYYNGDIRNKIMIIVQGVSEKGLIGLQTVTYEIQ